MVTTTVVKSEASGAEELKETAQEEVKEQEDVSVVAEEAAKVVVVSGTVAALDGEEKSKLIQEIARY